MRTPSLTDPVVHPPSHSRTPSLTDPADGVSLLAATIRTLLAGAPKPLPSLLAAGRLADGAQRLPLAPRTVITTHFREILDFDLLGLQPPLPPPPPATPTAEGAGPGGGTSEGALPLPPLPPATAGELSLYQMQVVLDRAERAAALAGKPVHVAVPRLGSSSGGGGGGGAGEQDADEGDEAPEEGGGDEQLDDAHGGAGGSGGGDDELDTVVPLFRLVAGRAASSYGLDCARKGGIPKSIVDRARAVTRSLAAPGGRVEALPAPARGAAGASASRELAQLRLARVLLSTPDWRAASAEQLVAALQALHGATTSAGSGAGTSA